MPAASLRKLNTTSQSWLFSPKPWVVQAINVYVFRLPQLPSRGFAVSLISMSQTCCCYWRYTCTTCAFCVSEAVDKDVLIHLLCSDLALVSELAHLAGPTDSSFAELQMALSEIHWSQTCSCSRPAIEVGLVGVDLQYLQASLHVACESKSYLFLNRSVMCNDEVQS